MAGPLVYVDTSDVRPGAADEIRGAIDRLVAFIEENEPELLAYGGYLSDDATQMTVVHVHTHSASLEYHLEVGGPAFRPFVDLIDLRAIDVYGEPSPAAVGKLRAKAEMLGSGKVRIRRPAGGFERFDPG